MTHSYHISGMTCSGCQAKVQHLLSQVSGVKNVTIDLGKGEAAIEMERHIGTPVLQEALKAFPKYQLTEAVADHHQDSVQKHSTPGVNEEEKSWWQTYKPVLLLFGYIIGITLLVEIVSGGFDGMRWMGHFMAGFFLAFSFFKLLNLQSFAESYATYDIIARRWMGWGYLYAFTELALGLAFLTGFNPVFTNWVTLVVMSISIIGVLQTVLNKRKIRCACLGAVFNLPMSTITIIEDGLMIVMSGVMLINLS